MNYQVVNKENILARALVKDSDLILLDEPSANLDFKQAGRVERRITKII